MEFLVTLLAPMLWASATLTDKMLVTGNGVDSKPSALMAVSGFFNLLFGILIIWPIMLWYHQINQVMSVDAGVLIPLLLNGATQTVAMVLFLKAITHEEVSRVDPWFQTIPALGIVLAFVFIDEKLAWYHIAAIALLAIGGWIIKSSGKVSRKVIIFMLIASLLLATNDVIFAKFGRSLDMMPAVFCDVMGKALWGLILLVGPNVRKGFILGLKSKIRLQSISEVLFISADFVFDRAKIIAPVAIVQGIACSQPVFTIVGAALLTKFAPKILSEEQGGAFWKKLGGIMLIITGGVVIAITR